MEAPGAVLSHSERAAQVESFDQVWKTIRDKHWDPKLGGLNWDALRTELRPKIEAATTAVEAREVLSDLIGRLGQSHFNIIPAGLYQEVAAAEGTDRGDGTAGLRVTVVGGQALVQSVEPDSAANTAGVSVGWVVERVGDDEIAPLLRRIGETYAGSSLCQARLIGAVSGRLDGYAGDTLRVAFRDGGDVLQQRELTLRTPCGKRIGIGHLPPHYVVCEHYALPNGVGYLRLNCFLDPAGVMTTVDKAVAEFVDAPGVVLDLRGNPGGIAGMGTGLAGFFLDAPKQSLGTMRTRDTTLKLTINPRSRCYGGPLAILIDGGSASTSEFVAGGLRDLGRARVFGTRSAGAALPSVIDRLPNGDGFQYAIANYLTVGGATLEGAGVAPDEEVIPTRAALLAGRDPVLDAAVAWIGTATGAGVAVRSPAIDRKTTQQATDAANRVPVAAIKEQR